METTREYPEYPLTEWPARIAQELQRLGLPAEHTFANIENAPECVMWYEPYRRRACPTTPGCWCGCPGSVPAWPTSRTAPGTRPGPPSGRLSTIYHRVEVDIHSTLLYLARGPPSPRKESNHA